MPSVTGNYLWEFVGIPLVSGVDLNTRARLVEKSRLLKAENVYFPRNGGPEIRRGHVAKTVDDAAERHIPTTRDHLYGHGLVAPGFGIGWASSAPGAGNILALATRDEEVMAWDGHRLFTHHTSDGKSSLVQGKALFPTAKTSTIAKTSFAQNYSDAADNGVVRVVVTKNTSTNVIHVFCYDSESGSLRFTTTLGTINPSPPKAVNVGSHIHIYVCDNSAQVLHKYVFHQSAYTVGPVEDLGSCNGNFDIAKFKEELIVLAKCTALNIIICSYFDQSGVLSKSHVQSNFTPDLSGSAANFVAVAVDPITSTFCLMWRSNAAVRTYTRVYSMQNVPEGARVEFSSSTDVKHITVANVINYVDQPGSATYMPPASWAYFEDSVPAGGISTVRLEGGVTKYNVHLASKAFTVGNRAFVYLCYATALQTQYILVDQSFRIVGRVEYGTAVSNTVDVWLPTVNYVTAPVRWQTYNFHCALLYRLRILTQSSATQVISGVFQETSTKFVEMNFLPKLTSAQMGRSTYFSGAMLWMYDGRELSEANFIAGPEGYTFAESNTASGALTVGTRRYRVYLVHKNAQGEEVRSPAFLSGEVQTTGVNDTITITGKTIPTNKSDSYFLVYRNENFGTLWHLVSDRDPSSANCPKNLQTSGTWTFVDTLADGSTTLSVRELDPSNNPTWIQPWAAPSCELVAFGKDRLWVSGGEIAPGEVWASRLANGAEVPGFSPVLAVTLDKTSKPITAIGFVADYVILFKEKDTYILAGQLSGNVFQGNSTSTQLALSEIGASSPHTARVSQGCIFQSSGGYRMITPGGEIKYMGMDVDAVRGTLVGMVVNYNDRNVRMYQSDNVSPVMDYESGEWSTFTIKPNAAIANPTNGLAILAVGNKLYFETENIYTDDGGTYKATIRTAWLGVALGGFQRVRRIGAIGEFYAHHKVRVNVYQDEAVGFTERFDWDTNQSLNGDTWGFATNVTSWGTGVWGDSIPNSKLDSVWRWTRRLSRQKCSAVSIEIELDSRYGKAVVPTAIMLEIGNKNTMQKIPTRTY